MVPRVGLDEELMRIIEGLQRLPAPIWLDDEIEVEEPRFEEKPHRKQREREKKRKKQPPPPPPPPPQKQQQQQQQQQQKQSATILTTVSPSARKRLGQDQTAGHQSHKSGGTSDAVPDDRCRKGEQLSTNSAGLAGNNNNSADAVCTAAALASSGAASAALVPASVSSTVPAGKAQALPQADVGGNGKGSAAAVAVVRNVNLVAAMVSPSYPGLGNPSRPLISRGRSPVCIQVESIQVFSRSSGSLFISATVAPLPTRSSHREPVSGQQLSVNPTPPTAADAHPHSPPPSGCSSVVGLPTGQEPNVASAPASSALAAEQQPLSPVAVKPAAGEQSVGCSEGLLSSPPSSSASSLFPGSSPYCNVRREDGLAAVGMPHGTAAAASPGQVVGVPPPPLFGMHQDKKRSGGKSKFKPPLNRGWKALSAALGLGFLKENSNQGGVGHHHNHQQHHSGSSSNWFLGPSGSHHHHQQHHHHHHNGIGGHYGQWQQGSQNNNNITGGSSHKGTRHHQQQQSYAPASAPARSLSPSSSGRHHPSHLNFFIPPVQSRLFQHQHGYSSSGGGGALSPLSRSQELQMTSSDTMLGWSDTEGDGDWTPRSFVDDGERQLRTTLGYRRLEPMSDEAAAEPSSGGGKSSAASSSTSRKRFGGGMAGGGGASSAAVDLEAKREKKVSPVKRRLHTPRRHGNLGLELIGTSEGGVGGGGGDSIGVAAAADLMDGFSRTWSLMSKGGGGAASPPSTSGGTPRHLVVSHGRTASSNNPFLASSDVEGDESSSGASGCASPGGSRFFCVEDDEADQIPWLPCYSEKRQKIQAIHFLYVTDDSGNRTILSDEITDQSKKKKSSKEWREQWRPCSPYPKEAKGRLPGSYLFEDEDDDDSFIFVNGERLGTNSGLLGVKLREAREAEKKVPKREERQSNDALDSPTRRRPRISQQPQQSTSSPSYVFSSVSFGSVCASLRSRCASSRGGLSGEEEGLEVDDGKEGELSGLPAARPESSPAPGCLPISPEEGRGRSVRPPPLALGHCEALGESLDLSGAGDAQKDLATTPRFAGATECREARRKDVDDTVDAPDSEGAAAAMGQEESGEAEGGKQDKGNHHDSSGTTLISLRSTAAASVANAEASSANELRAEAEGCLASTYLVAAAVRGEGGLLEWSSTEEEAPGEKAGSLKGTRGEMTGSQSTVSSCSSSVVVATRAANSSFMDLEEEERIMPPSLPLAAEGLDPLVATDVERRRPTVGSLDASDVVGDSGDHRNARLSGWRKEAVEALAAGELGEAVELEIGTGGERREAPVKVVGHVSVEPEVGSLRHWFPSVDVAVFGDGNGRKQMVGKADEGRGAHSSGGSGSVRCDNFAVGGGLADWSSAKGEEKSRERGAVVASLPRGEYGREERGGGGGGGGGGGCTTEATYQRDSDGGGVVGPSGYLDDDEREDGEAAMEHSGAIKDGVLLSGWEESGVEIPLVEGSDTGTREKRRNSSDGGDAKRTGRSKDSTEGRKSGGDCVGSASTGGGKRRGRVGRTLEQLALPRSSSGGFYDDMTTEDDADAAAWKGGRTWLRRKEQPIRERRDCLRWSNPLYNASESTSPPLTPNAGVSGLLVRELEGGGVFSKLASGSGGGRCVSQRRPNLRYNDVDLMRSSTDNESTSIADGGELDAADVQNLGGCGSIMMISEKSFLDVVDNLEDDVPPVLFGEASLLDAERKKRTKSMWRGWPDLKEQGVAREGEGGGGICGTRRVEMELQEEEDAGEDLGMSLDMEEEEEEGNGKTRVQRGGEDRAPSVIASDRWFGRNSASLFLESRRTRRESTREVLPADWRLPSDNSSSSTSSRKSTFPRHIPLELVEPLTMRGTAFRSVSGKRDQESGRVRERDVPASPPEVSDSRSCRPSLPVAVPRLAEGQPMCSAHFQCSFGSDCPDTAHGHWYLDNNITF
ncbi:hypothetical protein CBR_g51042 [Chara braunii]|uniref:Uncharacterized protein n=1 Tax=Chara braunii TaxID=69332 RepID=A0A388K5X4_CHABU|nr:hypothetical protein CBR_g51042 [Chara braunii]|eukprot:GBG65447.1 hypothetical protein CBR_g51042 [Chara braunii]